MYICIPRKGNLLQNYYYITITLTEYTLFGNEIKMVENVHNNVCIKYYKHNSIYYTLYHNTKVYTNILHCKNSKTAW